jgi:hypothetical protein
MSNELHLYKDGRRTLLSAVATGAYAFDERDKTEIADEVWELHSQLTDLTDECGKDYRLVITVEEEQ